MAGKRAITNNYALYNEGQASAPHIEVPSALETTAIAQAIDPWNQSYHDAQQPQNQSGLPSVPDQLPPETIEAMKQQGAAQPEKPQQVQQEQVPEEEQEEIAAPVTPQSSFKVIRDAKDKAERERDAILAQMMEMQKRMLQAAPAAQPETEQQEQDFTIDDDGLVEGKYVKKIVNEIKTLKKQIKLNESQSYQAVMEAKIKATYPDFEKVVSKENVELLNEQFPDIAASLRDTKDLFSKASAAYNVIKKFGFYQEPKADMYQNDRVKAVVNAQKPRPLVSASPQQGESPLSKANAFANGLTPDLQKQLLAEMNAARSKL